MFGRVYNLVRVLQALSTVQKAKIETEGRFKGQTPVKGPISGPTFHYTRLQKVGCRVIYAGSSSLCGLGLEDSRVPIFWSLL